MTTTIVGVPDTVSELIDLMIHQITEQLNTTRDESFTTIVEISRNLQIDVMKCVEDSERAIDLAITAADSRIYNAYVKYDVQLKDRHSDGSKPSITILVTRK